MSEHHIASSDRELYVIGALDPARSAELEAHVAGCPACESALMAEARLELAFEQVARSPLRTRRAVRRGMSFVGAGAGALAMAAAILLWLVPGAGSRSAGSTAGAPGAAMGQDPIFTGPADASGSTARLDTNGIRRDDELDGG
jgi:anti-sigma factor RsiW